MIPPRTIVVSVNASKESDTSFRLALHELKAGDKLLIAFSRPLRNGSPHYEFATKGIQHAFDCQSAEVLNKYSTWAADAQVTFEAVEIEGAHASEAMALKCQEVSASLLIQPASATRYQRLLRGELGFGSQGAEYCEACNPFLRGHGRHVRGSSGKVERGQVASPGCTVVTVPRAGKSVETMRTGHEYFLGTFLEGRGNGGRDVSANYHLLSEAA